MLHDPRHDKTPSLAGFALFVASKPEDETYDYRNCMGCAVGQYLTSLGKEPLSILWDGDIGIANDIARGQPVLGNLWNESLWTFGQLADRILAHQMA